ncbi:MAG: hydrogenase small subunit [Syntrophobacteraceae bacterium]|nr:hydrogenase small subunit [Syntrophobacteraceae bacterium]
MKISRRGFLKYCLGSAAALGLDHSTLGILEKVLATGSGPPIIWIAASNCTGCTVSLANRISTSKPVDVADLLFNTVSLAYHPNLMGAAGSLAVETALAAERSKAFILAVEGGIPTAFGGRCCYVWNENGRDMTALEVVERLAPKAHAVLSIGTCASFGGMSGAAPNPTGIRSVRDITGVSTVNIPGCPAHPDWIIGTTAKLLAGSRLSLDSDGRPTDYFRSTIHGSCPRNGRDWAETIGQEGFCLRDLGCKGPNTRGDCVSRKWNGGTSWCIGANAICIGCTEKGFPDRFSPFFSSAGALPDGHPRTENQSCSSCHGSSGPGGDDDDSGGGSQLPANHPPTGGQSCSTCH